MDQVRYQDMAGKYVLFLGVDFIYFDGNTWSNGDLFENSYIPENCAISTVDKKHVDLANVFMFVSGGFKNKLVLSEVNTLSFKFGTDRKSVV